MNMEAVLEGRRKCLIARNGDRRPFLCGAGTVRRLGLALRLSGEELSGGVGTGDGERWRERGMALASSGFLINTHSYLSISGRTWEAGESPWGITAWLPVNHNVQQGRDSSGSLPAAHTVSLSSLKDALGNSFPFFF